MKIVINVCGILVTGLFGYSAFKAPLFDGLELIGISFIIALLMIIYNRDGNKS